MLAATSAGILGRQLSERDGLIQPAELRERPSVPAASYSVTEIEMARQLVRSMGVDQIEPADRDYYALGLAALVEAKSSGLASKRRASPNLGIQGRATAKYDLVNGRGDFIRNRVLDHRRRPWRFHWEYSLPSTCGAPWFAIDYARDSCRQWDRTLAGRDACRCP
jgi:hypothetical protein